MRAPSAFVRILSLATVLGLTATAHAFVHSSVSADTLLPGKVAFQPYPGANPFQDYGFLLNSLSVGIYNGVEIGTVPLMWQNTDDISVVNFNVKNRLFHINEWTMAYGVQYINESFKRPEMQQYFDSFSITQLALALDYRPYDSKFEYRYNVATSMLTLRNYRLMTIGNSPVRMENYTMTGGADHYLDIQMNIGGGSSWILGLSRSHEWLAGLADPNSHPGYGAGLSYGWKIPNFWISGASVGFHYREGTGMKTLASITF